MSRIVYKSDFFKCTFSTVKQFNEMLQAKLDEYAADGWLLHSYHIGGEGASFCSMVSVMSTYSVGWKPTPASVSM